jgi:hypothetical protein
VYFTTEYTLQGWHDLISDEGKLWGERRMDDDYGAYAERVRSDHYLHWFAVILAAVWAGTIYGWLAGVGTLIGLQAVIALTNTIILARTASLRAIRVNRWAWVLLVILAIIISSAEIGSAHA